MTEATTSLLNQRTSNIRDKRDRRWFWTDNALIEDYGRALGIYAIGVYMVLCERAYNQTQRAEVSGGVIADLLGIGRSSVTEALFVLELHEVIDIHEQYDNDTRQQLPSVYTLLSTEGWRLEPTPEREEFVNARREAEKLKRTTPKAKPKRVTRRKKSESESEHTELKQGMPPGIIPPIKPAKTRGYAVTRHRVSSGAAYPTVSDGKAIPSGTDKYKQDVIQDVKTDNNKQSLATEMSVADENFSNSDLAPLAPTPEIETPQQSVKTKLLDFAGVRNIKATPDEIDALLQKWPAAKLSDGELVSALMSDYEIYSLDKPADENIARAAVKADADRLRWFMCVWPGFEEAGDAYHERTKHRWTKTSCFFKKWKTAQPPADWLEGELSKLRGAAVRERISEQDREARAFWDTLNPHQKGELNKETLAMLNQDSGGEHFTQSSDEFVARRRELLLEDDTRVWMAGLANSRKSSPPRVEAPDASEGQGPAPSISQMNLEVYIGPILAEIREGLLELEDIEERRIKILEDDEWEAVKSAVVERLAA